MKVADVVIIGSGFGGVRAARDLAKAGRQVTIVSATTESLFQPLLYQVATGVLGPGEIAPPVRSLLEHFTDVDVILGKATGVDPQAQIVTFETPDGTIQISYRYLIAATGATSSYFGQNDFEGKTFPLKTCRDALRLREQIQLAFEQAHVTDDEARRRELLTFVIAGGGPTGVEVAGQIAELGRRYFGQGCSVIRPEEIQVHIVEGKPELLATFGGKLSRYAQRTLEKAGITIHTSAHVASIDGNKVAITPKDGGAPYIIVSPTVIWCAGVRAHDFAKVLAQATGCTVDRGGQIAVNADCSCGQYNNIFAVGDMASLNNLPGLSPVAIQQAQWVAKIIDGKISSGTPFVYRNKGTMAIIDRFDAVAQINSRIKVTGFAAWVMWLGVHLLYLEGVWNRIVTGLSWIGSFLGHRRPHFHADVDPSIPMENVAKL